MSVIYKSIGTEESKISQEKININSNKNPINININQNSPKNCLYIRPISNFERNNEKINNLIHSSFNDPSFFFSIDSPVQIGHRIRLQKMDLLTIKDKHKGSLSLRNQQKKVNMSSKNTVTDISKSLYTIKENTKQNNAKSFMQNKEIIDNNSLKSIFEGYKKKIKSNRNLRQNENSFSRSVKGPNESIIFNTEKERGRAISNIKYNRLSNKLDDDEFPYDLYNSLNYQNKRIKNELNYFKQSKNLSKKLSKKINKDENELLINKVDLFKYKKEILTGIKKEYIPDKFHWDNSLRKPNNFKGKREYNINVSNESTPFWGKMIINDVKELSVKPGYNLNQKEFIRFSNDLKSGKHATSNNVKDIKNLDDLNVVGNNLLEVEYKREMSTKGRKILHKAFIENGKAILNQDINDIFGEITLYKNYENNEKNKYNNLVKYIKENKKDNRSILKNSFSEKHDNNNSIMNNFYTIPSKI